VHGVSKNRVKEDTDDKDRSRTDPIYDNWKPTCKTKDRFRFLN